jgi:uncharacterized membrane protein YqaE (UPF0057 family)
VATAARPCRSGRIARYFPGFVHSDQHFFIPGAAFARPAKISRGRRMDILKIILAILLPPLAVGLEVGLSLHFWLNVLLTILGWLPGVIHAVYVIASR